MTLEQARALKTGQKVYYHRLTGGAIASREPSSAYFVAITGKRVSVIWQYSLRHVDPQYLEVPAGPPVIDLMMLKAFGRKK